MISVCLCTYRRPQVLATLDSLARQLLPAGESLEIVVVDNDAEGSAGPEIRAWAHRNPLPLTYAVEPGPNIAAARNRSHALARGEWIASIDDDEVADATWICQLMAAVRTHSADAAIGRVVAQYPAGAPPWLVAADPFSRDLGPTGARLATGLTGNALLRVATLRRHGVRFDTAFGRTGGEDSDFFSRLVAAGGHIVACREAVVTEAVPPARLEPAYLRLRALRAGQSYAQIRLRSLPVPARLGFAALSSGKVAAFHCIAGLVGPARRSLAWQLRTRAWLNQGKLRACLRRPVPVMY